MRRARAACLFLLLAGGFPAVAAELVALAPRPNSELDTIARAVVADDLAKAAQKGEAPLVLVAEARLGGSKDRPALFIQLQSARDCGSAGCDTSVYIQRGGAWVVVLDSVGGPISTDNVRHGGMRDLLVGKSDRWVWNGRVYADTRPAAKLDLRRKP